MSSVPAEQKSPEQEQIDAETKAQWDAWDESARRYAKIQLEEAQKLKADTESKQLGSMSDRDFRAWTQRHCGWDPGV